MTVTAPFVVVVGTETDQIVQAVEMALATDTGVTLCWGRRARTGAVLDAVRVVMETARRGGWVEQWGTVDEHAVTFTFGREVEL